MPSYVERFNLIKESATFTIILAGAVADAAVAVLAETGGDPDLAAARISWARKSLADPVTMASKMAFAVSGVDGIFDSVGAQQSKASELTEAKDAAADVSVLDAKKQATDTASQDADSKMLAAVKDLVNGFVYA